MCLALNDYPAFFPVGNSDGVLGHTPNLLVSGVDTQRLVQSAETGRRVEPESESANDGEQPGLSFPRMKRTDSDEGQYGSEQCVDETLTATDV
jgi:hypothetical protein